MQRGNRAGQKGFTILETIIVLGIVGVLATLAIMQFRGAKTDFQRQNIVREFKNYLERARFDSVRRRADTDDEMATITLTGATSFVAKIDFNGDGDLSANETRRVDFADRSNTKIYVTDTLNYPVNIRFNRRGQTTAIDYFGNAVSPVFRICSNCSDATPQVSYISISSTGTIGDSAVAPSVLPTPQITSITSASYNCYALLTNTTTGCSQF